MFDKSTFYDFYITPTRRHVDNMETPLYAISKKTSLEHHIIVGLTGTRRCRWKDNTV